MAWPDPDLYQDYRSEATLSDWMQDSKYFLLRETEEKKEQRESRTLLLTAAHCLPKDCDNGVSFTRAQGPIL